MFDEQNNSPIPPTNLPAEPADMFADMERPATPEGPQEMPDALSSGLLKKKMPTAATPPSLLPVSEEGGMGGYKMSSPILGKIIVGLLIVLLLGGLAYGSWWFLYARKKDVVEVKNTVETAPKNNQDNQTTAPQSSENNAPSTSVPSQINNDQILFGQGIDLDKDGLDDVREREIKTNPQLADTDDDGLNDGDEVIVYKSLPLNPDTDNDGLSDGDEVLIWKTNLLNPDSDNDTYPDGTEVKNGYSPLGPGKLFSTTVPTSTTTTSASSTSTSTSTTTTK